MSLLRAISVPILCFAAIGHAAEPPVEPAAAADASTSGVALPADAGSPGVEPADEAPTGWWNASRATGDWFGLRPALEDRGITVEASYTFDFYLPAKGGLNTHDADTYFGFFDLSLALDTAALGLWKDGTIFIDFQDFRGESPTERHVGDLFVLNNADAPSRSQLSEFWYEQLFGDGLLRVKLGKQDANAEFAYSDYGGEFLNSGPGIIANIPIPTYPDPAMGASVFLTPADWLTWGVGVFDADGSGRRGGFDTAFHGRDDSFTITELVLRPSFKGRGGQMPGVYRVGGWYHSGRWDEYFNDLDGRLQPRVHRGNAGVYVMGEQLVWRESRDDPTDDQGLGIFGQFGWAPSRYNEIAAFYAGGLHYTGLFPGREGDVTGLGFALGSLSGAVQSLEGRYSETVVEAFHKFQLNEFLSVKPDCQYIFSPGGDGRDAIVLGLRVEIAF